MRTPLIMIAAIACTSLACNTPQKPAAPAPGTPQALQENADAGLLRLSKGRGKDMVEELYMELAEKRPELKELETAIRGLPEEKADSLKLFNEYSQNNDAYYASADRHLKEIKDSVLREKIKTLVAKSASQYKDKVAPHNSLIEALHAKTISLEDLHLALKITKTLTVIGQYQIEHLPRTAPLQDVIRKYEQQIQKTDSLMKE